MTYRIAGFCITKVLRQRLVPKGRGTRDAEGTKLRLVLATGTFLARNLTAVMVMAASIVFVGRADEPGTLTSLHAVHSLSNAEASHAIPIAVEATVVYARDYENLLFVQDGDAALFVRRPAGVALLPGDRLFIQGITQGSFRPLVVAHSITLLYHGALPVPAPATFDELIRGQFDSRRVTVHARVRAADLVVSPAAPKRSARLQLLMEGGHIEANVDGDDEETLKDLLDAEVEITGVAAGKFDDKMEQTGIVLYVSSLADVRVLNHATARFWTLPVTQMDQILSGYHVLDSTQRVQVHGTITYYDPGTAVVLEDGSKSLWISTHTREPLRVGDYAEATGFAEAHDRLLMLTDGEIEDLHILAPIAPILATWHQLGFWSSNTPDGHQNDLVSIDGRIVTEVREATQDEYVLDSDGRLFTAVYRHPQGSSAFAPMPKVALGSKVRVTGICTIPDANAINPGEETPFNILLRSFDDISVIASPSPLNVRNLTLLVGLLIGLLLTAGARAWVMDRQVRSQNADAAYTERRRSRILEDINGSRPLAEIIEQITELVSFKLCGAPCWCQIADGAQLGNRPPNLIPFRILSEQVSSRSGATLGTMFAAFDPLADPRVNESEILSMAAGLATLAIETRRLYSDLTHRSEFDLLTDIHNRFSLETYLDQQIDQTRQSAGIFGLIYIDLNDFKQVNDVYGHQIGDLYLQEVAMRMKRQLRGLDMLARLGGDEFAVVLPVIHSRKEVEEVAKRLEHSFDEPYPFDGYVLRGSASVGIALYPEDGTSRDNLLSAADAAMYVAKQTNRHADALQPERRNPDFTPKFRS
jgi:diguanylate cyclase (GGDEF)-like protein